MVKFLFGSGFAKLGIDKTSDVLDSTKEKESIERLYLTSLLDPSKFDQESNVWLKEIKSKLQEFKITEKTLPILDSNEINVQKAEFKNPTPVFPRVPRG